MTGQTMRIAPFAFWRGDMRRFVWPLATAAVLILQIILIATHEAWMDEYQALQIALASPDLSALLAALHYEGHPPLWYLMLRGMALIMPANMVLAATLLPIALSSQLIILRHLKLPRLDRLAIALGYTMLIDAGSISRSSSLGILLLLVAFTADRRWLRWLAIGLLPMADFLFGLLSMLCIAMEWRDGTLSRKGLLFWLVSSAAAAWSVLPAPDMVPALVPSDLPTQIVRLFVYLSPQIAPLHIMSGVPTWGGVWYPTSLAFAGGMLFPFLCIYLLRDAAFERALLLAFLAACALVSLFLYWLSPRHLALIGLFLILLRARAGSPDGFQAKVWQFWLIVGAAGGLFGAWLSLSQPFDPARAMASLIVDRQLDREEIVAWPEGAVQGVGILTGREFTSLTKGCTEGYHRWDHRERIDGRTALAKALARHADRHGRFYFLSELKLDPARIAVPVRLSAAVGSGYDGYSYNLYEVAGGSPRLTPLPGPCAPARLPLSQWWRN